MFTYRELELIMAGLLRLYSGPKDTEVKTLMEKVEREAEDVSP